MYYIVQVSNPIRQENMYKFCLTNMIKEYDDMVTISPHWVFGLLRPNTFIVIKELE